MTTKLDELKLELDKAEAALDQANVAYRKELMLTKPKD
tara:strand:+ start:739 stop:852 length:114 start_codon:yes stop_codon:yes gene_type:complete